MAGSGGEELRGRERGNLFETIVTEKKTEKEEGMKKALRRSTIVVVFSCMPRVLCSGTWLQVVN